MTKIFIPGLRLASLVLGSMLVVGTPLLLTSCGGSGNSAANAQAGSLFDQISGFLNGTTLLTIRATANVELSCNKGEAEDFDGTSKVTRGGWVRLSDGYYIDVNISCEILNNNTAALEVELSNEITPAQMRTLLTDIGIELSENISDESLSEQAQNPLKYQITLSQATGFTKIVLPNKQFDASAHLRACSLEFSAL
ncbi:MAG TPA: hypothetical protein H9862_07540 [Candidatus Akkermansia intestinigallinarum]|uniref:Uncharacterized protein n=1 Tax=Candidatus Akkermansia intestinigallinarum TaxID=2838431 RepID=A0A9D2AHF6_9BACT|nr:hypothetical protein [Candidatus Akkermansia intestinigallinarum]